MDVTSMKNIGAAMQTKLQAIGIQSAEALRQLGSKAAFVRLKANYPEVCLVHLYALQGAVADVELEMLPQAVKDDLKVFSDSMK